LSEQVNQRELLSQRVSASARIAVAHVDGRTRLSRLYQDGAAKIRMPRVSTDPLEAVLINTAGGLTGGDRIAWKVDIGAAASATIATQACEKIYRALSGQAEAKVDISVGAAGRMAWLPQETIVFERAAFARTLRADLAEGAEALIVEATVFGRLAMGERTGRGLFRDRWRVRQNGVLVHAEDFAIGPDIGTSLRSAAVTGGNIAVATVLLVSEECESLLAAAREAIGERGGASAWTVGKSGKLLARLHAEDSYDLRRHLVPLIQLLNGQAGLPKAWSL
jgi:urease accessory protein